MTEVLFDGNGSYDPDGSITEYSWSYDCRNAESVTLISNTSSPSMGSTLMLGLTAPGEGLNVLCSVKLSVTDDSGEKTECEADVQISKCALDCQGTINGSMVIDDCGICGGDNTSCLDCNSTDISNTQLLLDGSSFNQRNLIRNGIRQIRRISKKSKAFSALKKEAESLYLENWSLVWSVPSVILDCNNPVSDTCAELSNTTSIAQYELKSNRLHEIGLKVVRKLRRVSKKRSQRRKANRIKKELVGELETLSVELNSIPEIATACS